MNKSYFYLEMKTHELKVPYTGKLRRVRVLLPKNYETDTDRRYPVVYFHDGQNVFYSKEAYVGHSWKVIPAIKRNPDISRMIVVAIDNDGLQRMNEGYYFDVLEVQGIQYSWYAIWWQGRRVWGVCHGCGQTFYRSRISHSC